MFGNSSKISWAEAEKIVRLYRERAGVGHFVDAKHLAESLSLTEEQFQELRAEAQASPVTRPNRFNLFADRSAWLSVGITAVVIGTIGIGSSLYARTRGNGQTVVVGTFSVSSKPKILAPIRIEQGTMADGKIVTTELQCTARGSEEIVKIQPAPRIADETELPSGPDLGI